MANRTDEAGIDPRTAARERYDEPRAARERYDEPTAAATHQSSPDHLTESTISRQLPEKGDSPENLSDDWEFVEDDSESDTLGDFELIKQTLDAASDEDQSEHDEESILDILTIEVPLIPSRKERRKDLSHVLAKINLILHDMDWTRFDKYAKQLLATTNKHRQHDYEACVRLHQCYVMRVTTGALPALQSLEESRELIQSSPSTCFLTVRFLAMKAFLLYFLGRQDEATTLHEEAIHLSVLLEPNNPSALNLYYYALNSVLHNRRLWDKYSGIPLEQTWEKAESAYRDSCNHNRSWVNDLDDDPKIGEADTSFFYLLTFIKYIMCMLRTCAAPEGFFRLMTNEHGVSVDALNRVEQYMEYADQQSSNMFPRCLLYYYLAKSDFNIRRSQNLCYDKEESLNKAYRWAVLARDVTDSFKEAKLSRFVREFGLCRLAYIAKQLQRLTNVTTSATDESCIRTTEDQAQCPFSPINRAPDCGSCNYLSEGGHFTPLAISKQMSHMDVFKKSQDTAGHLDDCGQFTESLLGQTLPKYC